MHRSWNAPDRRRDRPKVTTIEQMLDHISIMRFKRAGALRGDWRRLLAPRDCPRVASMNASRTRVSIIWRNRAIPPQVIEVQWRRVGFGWRAFLTCPCGRRASRLYLRDDAFRPSYRCHRRCHHGVLHASQCQSASGRKAYRASKQRMKLLRGSARLTDPIPPRPRGMWRRKYERIAAVLAIHEAPISRTLRHKLPDYDRLQAYS
jgi:hypothetical protein